MAFDKTKIKNPSMNYISNIAAEESKEVIKDKEVINDKEEIKNDKMVIPEIETKSKRLNLLVYPSLSNDLQKIAAMKGTKVNNLINQIFMDYTKSEEAQNYIEAYNKIKK
jgi:hypothetical protein